MQTTIEAGSDRRRRRSRHVTAALRDVIEVLAIIAAGTWAVYVFVYEQRIKPAQTPAQIVVTGALSRAGERNGLVAYRYNVVLRNTGSSPFYTIAIAYAATGIRVARGGVSRDRRDGVPLTYERDAHPVARVPLYRDVLLGYRSGPPGSGGYDVNPGTEIPESGVFFVRRADVDEIVLSVSVAFSKYDRVYPTHVSLNAYDDVLFSPKNPHPAYDFYQVVVDHIAVR